MKRKNKETLGKMVDEGIYSDLGEGIFEQELVHTRKRKQRGQRKQQGQRNRGIIQNPFGDFDRDGVLNIFDCEPLNPKKQGILHGIFGDIRKWHVKHAPKRTMERWEKEEKKLRERREGKAPKSRIPEVPKRVRRWHVEHAPKKVMKRFERRQEEWRKRHKPVPATYYVRLPQRR